MFKRFKNENYEDKNKKYNALANYQGDPFYRQLFFFGFYLVFFIIVILLLRTAYKRNATSPLPTKTGEGVDFEFTELKYNNYHFTYKETLNGVETVYEGEILDKTSSFVKSGNESTEYYKQNDKYYVKDRNLLTWSETTNPLSFYSFTLPHIIERMTYKGDYISNSYYIKTEDKEFTYEISNNTIRSMLDLEELKNDNTKTEIIVRTNKNKKIEMVTLDLSNYYKSIDPNVNNYIIKINYSKIGKIEEIANPIN